MVREALSHGEGLVLYDARVRKALLYALVLFIFSTTWLAIRVGVRDFAPIGFVGLRLAIAGPALVLLAFALRLAWPRTAGGWLFPIVLGVTMFGGPLSLIYIAEQTVPGGRAAVIWASYALFVALLAHRFLPDEPLTSRRVLGIASGTVGLAVVFHDKMRGHGGWLGEALLVLSAATQSCSVVALRTFARDISSIVLSAIGTTTGAIVTLLVGWLVEGPPVRAWTRDGTIALLYLAIAGSIVAFTGSLRLVRTMGANAVATMVYMTPVLALTWGALFLHETLDAGFALGAAFILGGVWLANHPVRKAA